MDYTYSISADFPHLKVAPDRLMEEICASAVVTALGNVGTVGDVCTVTFKAALSSGDKTILDSLVAAHSGEPMPGDALPVQLCAADGSASPVSNDGKLIMLPCMFPPGVQIYFAGCGDDPVNGRGAGVQFALSSDAAGDVVREFGFSDWCLLAGGDGASAGAELGDYATFEAVAPASVVTANPGGTGNCNLVPIGGGVNLIVPAAGDGSHDVDLATAVPLPAGKPGEKSGYWEWDWPDTGKGSISPGIPGKGEFHLLDVPRVLNRQCPKYQLLGERQFSLTIPAVNPSALLPQWRLRVTLHNGGHAGLKVVWGIVLARYVTV